MRSFKISVIVPAKNEAANIPNMLELLTKNFDRQINEIIFVNDCSSDESLKLLNSLKKTYPKLKPIHRKNSPGVGNAMKDGLQVVSPSSSHVLMLDCDFTKNTPDIKKMLLAIGELDGILGSRYVKGSKLINYPPFKKVANRSFHKILRTVLKIKHADTTNNFRLYKKEVIDWILPKLKSESFSINAELGVFPILAGFNVKEIPVSWIERTQEMGTSNFKVLKAGPGYIKVLSRAIIDKVLHRFETRQESERDHFDKLVKETGETYYGNLRPVAKIRFARKSDTILNLASQIKNPKILDLGCGTGILSGYLLQKKPKLNIVGVDISPNAIKIAKKKLDQYPNASFITGDICKLPFNDKEFDIVIGNSVLHHVPLEPVLKEFKRVLKRNGLVWFCEPNMLNPQIYFEKNAPVIKSLFQDSPHETAFTKWQLNNLFVKNGFKNIQVRPYEFLHPLLPKAMLSLTSAFCIMLEKTPLIKEFAGTVEVRASLSK